MQQGQAPEASATEGDGAGEQAQAQAEELADTAAAAPVRSLERIHLLPIGTEVEGGPDAGPRLAAIAPELRQRRETGEVIRGGDVFRQAELEFAIIKCDPEEGILGPETDYFLDGSLITVFEKIQFSAWGAEEMSSEDLFLKVVAPYLKCEFGAYKPRESMRARLFHCGQTFQIGDIYFQVEATEPGGLGVVTTQSEIFATWDSTPEFERVHIIPFQDTLPSVYDYNLFEDYIRPYLEANKHKKFQQNELFMYHGVQFKMVACEPNQMCRIGRQTTVFDEGVLHPSLRNLLPPELLGQVSQLPVGLQMLLLNTERTARELEDVMTHRRGLFPETIDALETFRWPPQDTQASHQNTCMICLSEFELSENCKRLPCQHVFHSPCIEEWLRRCTDCPICKDNVDRAIRGY